MKEASFIFLRSSFRKDWRSVWACLWPSFFKRGEWRRGRSVLFFSHLCSVLCVSILASTLSTEGCSIQQFSGFYFRYRWWTEASISFVASADLILPCPTFCARTIRCEFDLEPSHWNMLRCCDFETEEGIYMWLRQNCLTLRTWTSLPEVLCREFNKLDRQHSFDKGHIRPFLAWDHWESLISLVFQLCGAAMKRKWRDYYCPLHLGFSLCVFCSSHRLSSVEDHILFSRLLGQSSKTCVI